MYLGLKNYMHKYGQMYKLCFGPKSFIVVSEPAAVKHILRDNAANYNKGALAEILEDIMGKGLIPADPETWKVRRRAIVPAFHKKWLGAMVGLFGDCGVRLVAALEEEGARQGNPIDMEERFGSVALDIIGKAVFNYDFESVESTSPVRQTNNSYYFAFDHPFAYQTPMCSC
jgi:cytochrome P450